MEGRAMFSNFLRGVCSLTGTYRLEDRQARYVAILRISFLKYL